MFDLASRIDELLARAKERRAGTSPNYVMDEATKSVGRVISNLSNRPDPRGVVKPAVLVKIVEPELSSHHKKGEFLVWQDFEITQ